MTVWWTEFLADVAIRGTLLLALAWLTALLLRGAWPSVRRALWTSVTLGVLALPLLTLVLPPLAILPALPTVDLSPVAAAAPAMLERSDEGGLERLAVTMPELDPVGRFVGRHGRALVLGLWLGGFTAACSWIALGLFRLRCLTREAHRVAGRIERETERLRAEIGIRRRVRLLVSDSIASPATWGWWRPTVMLPGAALAWTAERLDLVLAHELTHIARQDWTVRLLARLACAFYWYQPVAWMALNRLRVEQEMACDDAVLGLGARPSAYAQHLLAIARAARGLPAVPLPALDLARRGQMEGRLMSILDERSKRALRGGALAPALILIALPVLAAIQSPPPEAPPAPEALQVDEAAPISRVTKMPSAAPKLATIAAPAADPAPALALSPVAAPAVVAHLATPAAPAAPQSSDPEPLGAPAPPAPAEDREGEPWGELDEELERRMEEIERLMAPIQEELEREMEQSMLPILEQMEVLELEMRPVHEEMSRIGAELSEIAMQDLGAGLDAAAISDQAEALADAAMERARLARKLERANGEEAERIRATMEEVSARLARREAEMEALRATMGQRHAAHGEEIRARMEAHRGQMEAMRARMEPHRERMEALRAELEPIRERVERLHRERLAEVNERVEQLNEEIRLRMEERWRERSDDN